MVEFSANSPRVIKLDILSNTDFGHRIAEEEAHDLADYFVETNQWKSMFSGEVDIAYGAKGSGKSAIYSLLLSQRDVLGKQRIHLIPAENPRGTPVFRELVTDPPTKEAEFRSLWKLYFLCLVGDYLAKLKNLPDVGLEVVRKLQDSQLLPSDGSLGSILRSVQKYVRNLLRAESVGVGLELDPVTGMPSGIDGKITLREPDPAHRDTGLLSVDELLKLADRALHSAGNRTWILLDRLDVAFADSPELESGALRALFRVYLDLVSLQAIRLKIFLRTDIWGRITYQGTKSFPEASHIVRHTTITWTNQSLLNLVVRRLFFNEAIRLAFGVDHSILTDTGLQNKLWSRVFPPQATLDWMLSRVRDGTRRAAPREVIHMLHCAKEIQIKKLELGGGEPEGEALFRFETMKQALKDVSKVRFEQTLCAEYPELHSHLARLGGETSLQSVQTLSECWKETPENTLKIAERLVSIGFFEKMGSRNQPLFWVPYLYQSALEMKEPKK